MVVPAHTFSPSNWRQRQVKFVGQPATEQVLGSQGYSEKPCLRHRTQKGGKKAPLLLERGKGTTVVKHYQIIRKM